MLKESKGKDYIKQEPKIEKAKKNGEDNLKQR